MNQVSMSRKRLDEYKAVVFDLDGTLYYQKPFRLRMIRFLAGYLLMHPKAIKDMLIILEYRKIREDWERYEDTMHFEEHVDIDSRQYSYVASKKRTTPEHVQEVIQFFMLDAPLKLMYDYRDHVLARKIEELYEKQVKIVIYSDYPVTEKLKALQMQADMCFTSADEEIDCMKPDPKGLEMILKHLQMKPEEVIMVGDRYEKDGLAAVANHMDFIILDANKKKRHMQERELL